VKRRREAEPDEAEVETELLDDNDLIEVATTQAKEELGDLNSLTSTGCWPSAAPRAI
jgi:hypothetical protein